MKEVNLNIAKLSARYHGRIRFFDTMYRPQYKFSKIDLKKISKIHRK